MKVSVITATIGKPQLAKCIESIRKQTYKNVEHIVVLDGNEHWVAADQVLKQCSFPNGTNEHLIILPFSTGKNRYNGHRIYGACTYLANGDYLIWLDDDNSLEENHVESLVKLVQKNNLDWAYSFRKIVDDEDNVICDDDCENLGQWKSVLNDYFVDVNCFFVNKNLALSISPIWYRQAREPGVVEVDRALSACLMHEQNKLKFDASKKYTVRYRVGSTGISVKKEFFLEGNKKINQIYNGKLPWKE